MTILLHRLPQICFFWGSLLSSCGLVILFSSKGWMFLIINYRDLQADLTRSLFLLHRCMHSIGDYSVSNENKPRSSKETLFKSSHNPWVI